MVTRFRSKVDRWIIAMAAIPLGVVFVVIVGASITQQTAAPLIALPILALVAAAITWSLRSTDYTIDGAELLIRSSGLRWRIPIMSIDRITPTRSMLSAPALSLDRLAIHFAGDQRILVSPEDKAGFVAALRVVNPAIRASLAE